MSKQLFGVLFCVVVLVTAILVRDHAGASPARPRPQVAATIELEPVVTGLSSPLYVTSARDGTNRLFIVERAGVIKVLQPGSSSPTTFLDITSKVKSDTGGAGLLGLVFHLRFSVNRRFFVYYNINPDATIVVAEYLASATNPDTAEVAEKVLLSVPRARSTLTDHNAGTMHFRRDGFLYITIGDGGGVNDPLGQAQNINVYYGKMLRIDVDHPNGSVPYSSPPDNPFFGSTAGLDEIYAYGLRNPWQFSIDRVTDQIYAGDVGQRDREEVDIVTSGGNYGWRIMEGSICNPGLHGGVCTPPADAIPPIAEYTHAYIDEAQMEKRCSITGGYVYRGARSTFPAGTYVFGDYCTGEILMLDGNNQIQLLLNTPQDITAFGEDEASELYVVSIHDGTLNRITSSPPPPACTFSLTPTSQSFPDEGGTGSISVTAGDDCQRIAASNVNWIKITSGKIGTGSDAVNFTVAVNRQLAPRSGKINIGGQQFVVDQAPSDVRTISSLKLSASILPGCQSLTGTVTLNAPAPSGGTIVALSDNIAATTLPATITIHEGETTKTFTIKTVPVNAAQVGSVWARIGPSTKGATLKVRPMTISLLNLIPNPVVGPNPVTGKLILECRAPSGGLAVSLSSNSPTVASPTVGSVNVAAGTTTKSFSIRTADVASSRTAVIKATANGITKSKLLTVN